VSVFSKPLCSRNNVQNYKRVCEPIA
jgi:hypothetical protein